MSRDTIRLPHDAYRLLQTLRAAGHSAYVVGGCVRDSLLGRLPGDWDNCTSARPDEMRALFHDQRMILTGEKHGTVAVTRDVDQVGGTDEVGDKGIGWLSVDLDR